MTLLSLDQSSRITGWCIFENNMLKGYGKIDLKTEDIGQRLVQFRNSIINLLDKYNPDEVVFEDIQLQNNVGNNIQTFKILAEVYGILLQLLTERRIKNSSILSTSWKSTLNIKGRSRPEQKKNAQIYVKENYNIDVIQDIADAACIGAAHLQKQKSAWV